MALCVSECGDVAIHMCCALVRRHHIFRCRTGASCGVCPVMALLQLPLSNVGAVCSDFPVCRAVYAKKTESLQAGDLIVEIEPSA